MTETQDYERFAENLYNSYQFIDNTKKFNVAFDEYLNERGFGITKKQDTILRQKSLGILKDRGIISGKEDELFNDAGGKDLKRDRANTAQTVVNTEEEYIRRGASRVDLRGYDTKRFDSFGKTRDGRVVKGVTDTVTFRTGREQEVIRDRKGRFLGRIR